MSAPTSEDKTRNQELQNTRAADCASYFWADYTTVALEQLIQRCERAAADGENSHHADSSLVVVLPLGATEQHGPHLPLHTDSSIVDAVVQAALPRLQKEATTTLFLPTQQITLSPEHTNFAGTLSLRPETCMQVWLDIGRSVAAAGVRKLLLFNAHGGNAAMMDIVARQLRMECGLFTAHSSWHQLPLGDAVQAFDAHEWRYGIHAGAIETSIMQHVSPEHVRSDRVADWASTSQWRTEQTQLLGDGKSCKLGWAMEDYSASGAAGRATLASAEAGKDLVESAGAALAQLLQELSALPLRRVMGGKR